MNQPPPRPAATRQRDAGKGATEPSGSGPAGAPQPGVPPALAFWIRTPCGRAKYAQLAARPGPLARLRLGWFVLIAALRDLGQPLPQPPEPEG